MIAGLSILPIIVAAIADMIIGSFWYSPLLFGPLWQKELGIKNFDMKDVKKTFGYTAVNALVMATVLAFLLKKFDITTIDSGLETAFLFWLGFVATTNAVKVIFEKAKVSVYIIAISYQLISLMVMSMILTSWK